MAEDALGQLWLGSESGAFRLTGDSITHFDERRGLSDNAVNHIFPDAENNLWFATNADGIFKFRENTFTYYDKSSGLLNPIIMGVTETPDRLIYTGGYGGGLYMIRNSDPQLVLNRDGSPFTHKINCLYADDENNVWIGTLNHGIWKYSVKQGFTRLTASGAQDIRSATCFLKTRSGDLLIGGNQGLFVLRNEKISRVDMPARLITSMKQFSDSQVIAGTSRGIFLIDKSFKASPFAEKHFHDASVLCLALHGEHLWVGTSDKGVFNYDMNKKALLNYNTTDGLPSNFIYSIHAEGDVAWIGTGYGICNLKVDRNGTVKALKNYGRSDGLLGMECNHNSLLKGRDSSLWFGTTKGLFHFNPNSSRVGTERPVVLLRSVKLYSSPITDSAFFKNKENWFNVPQGLKLPARQNHLTFELSSIYFTNPDNILFRYKLQGVDKNFSVNSNPILIYPSIPPGTYTLIVKAFTKNGMESVNSVHYSFTIQKAFYQTRWFQFVVIMLLLLTGGVIAWAFTVGRQRRKQKEKEMLARIREEEFQKLRQRTAEDFHDEMGNSLTRISVLTDVLKTRVNGKETEVTRLVNQIKENTTALYNGSRDIIWSLNAQNDGVYEIAEHIKDIGLEMFHDTPVEFSYHHNIPAGSALKLKLDYSRNLTMIFKEAYSNIIRHSGADKVFVSLNLKNDSELLISITDNGKGFSTTNNKNGNGLRNMENRVRRMQGELQVTSEQKKGTEINMRFNSIFTN
jgi:signal transduction histidine kinase